MTNNYCEMTTDSKNSKISQTSLLFTIYCIETALLILHFRHWDINIVFQVLGTISYPLFVFGGVAIAYKTIADKYPQYSIWVLPIFCLLFLGLPSVTIFLGKYCLFLLGSIGLINTFFVYITDKKNRSTVNTVKIFLWGISLSIIYFLVVNGYNYAHILSDVSAHLGTLHRDTLFHSSIIQMIANFGVASTGLDGLIPLNYHVSVHQWVANNLNLLGGSAPVLLAISQQIAFLPLAFYAFIIAIILLSPTSENKLATYGLPFLALWFMGTLIWDSYLASESYAFSIPLMVAMVPVGQSWLIKSCNGLKPSKTLFASILLTSVAIIACQSAKISSGIILAIFLLLSIITPIFLKRILLDFRYLLGLIPIACLLFIACLGLAFLFSGSLPLSFYPFHFARTYKTQFISQISFFVLMIVANFYLFKFSFIKNKLYFYCLMLTLTVTFICSLVPGLLLAIGGGSAGYFVQPILLITVVFTVSSLLNFCATSYDNQKILFSTVMVSNKTKLRWKRLVQMLTIFLIIVLLTLVFQSSPPELSSYIDRAKSFGGQTGETLELFSDHKARVGQKLDKINLLLYPPAISVEKIDPLPVMAEIAKEIQRYYSHGASTNLAIYISPDYDEFWQAYGQRTCWDTSFIVPAMTGLPLLNGVRATNNNCDLTPYYGMADYNSDSWNRVLSTEQICDRAKKKGFNRVLLFTGRDPELLDCTKGND